MRFRYADPLATAASLKFLLRTMCILPELDYPSTQLKQRECRLS